MWAVILENVLSLYMKLVKEAERTGKSNTQILEI